MKNYKNEIIVTFLDEDNIDDIVELSGGHLKKKVHTKAMDHFGHKGFHVLEVPNVEQVVKKLKDHPNVKSVSPNFTVTTQAYPDDPMFVDGSLWGMKNIKADVAWQTNKGSQNIYVGLIDEGIFYVHPDLCGQIWHNPFETDDNKIDDDSNGYVDDKHGWDFYNNDNSIFDASDKHGTHTAGTIGANGNNGMGVIGVCPNVTIISSKFLQGTGSVDAGIAAIDYLTDLKIRHGLNIVCMSNSWGYEGPFLQELYDAVERTRLADILFICAAGNNASDADSRTFYPACLSNDNVISVAAIDVNDNLASFSNWGLTNVDLGAPGVGVWSTNYDDNANPIYANFSGTSMATPHVSGAAALYKSGHPSVSYKEVKAAILNAVRPLVSLSGKCVTGGTLDVSTFTQGSTDVPQARDCPDIPFFDLTPPTQVQNVRTTNITDTSITLAWDPSSDPESGVYFYGLVVLQGGVAYQQITTFNTYLFHGSLFPGTPYTYTVYAINKSGKVSDPSVPLEVYTLGEKDTTPPNVPPNVRVTKQTETELDFAWDVPDDNEVVNGYFLECFDESMQWSIRGTTNLTTVAIGNLPTGLHWKFHVKAHDPSGNYSEYSDWVYADTVAPPADVEPPSIPVNLKVVAGQNSLTLSWDPATDNIAVSGYNVFINSIGSKTSGTSYAFQNLSPGTVYHLAVSAYDAAGNTSAPATIDGKTLAPPPPEEVIILSGTTVGDTRNLMWTLSGAINPMIELQQWAKGGWQPVKSGDASFTTYSYSQKGKKQIQWRVKVTDGANIIYSNSIQL